MNNTQTTLLNLYRLVESEILTTNSIAIYLFCKLNTEQVSLVQLQRSTRLSTTIIRHHLNLLKQLNLIIWTAERGKGSSISCLELSDKNCTKLLHNSSLVSSLSIYKDNKINKYNNKSYIINRINIYNKEGGSCHLLSVLENLPKSVTAFRITPVYKRKLETLAEEFDIKEYTKWFVKNKLGKTVKTFGLGIFLYKGILEEYRSAKKVKDKHDAYKHVTSRKSKFATAAQHLEEELNAAL